MSKLDLSELEEAVIVASHDEKSLKSKLVMTICLRLLVFTVFAVLILFSAKLNRIGVVVIVAAFVVHGIRDLWTQTKLFATYKGLVCKMSKRIIELEDEAKKN